MSSLRTSLPMVLLSALLLGGCGDTNSKVVFSPDSGHKAGWKLEHNVAARDDLEQCMECHGKDLLGGTSSVSCLKCHAKSPDTYLTGCASCHGNGNAASKGPTGSVAPDRAGSHAKHVAIPGVTCAVCHFGAGSGTEKHNNGMVNVTFLNGTTLRGAASTVVPNLTGGVCANVSCHGGKTTPAWYGGVAPACQSCHEQGTAQNAPQLNSYYSAGHAYHLAKINRITGVTIICTDCHNVQLMTSAQHFSGILSRTFSQPGATVGGVGTYLPPYNVSSKTCSAAYCHTLGIPNPKWNGTYN